MKGAGTHNRVRLGSQETAHGEWPAPGVQSGWPLHMLKMFAGRVITDVEYVRVLKAADRWPVLVVQSG